MRRSEHRIPSQPSEAPVMHRRAPHRKSVLRHSPAYHRQEEYRRELESNELSQSFPVWRGHSCPPIRQHRPHQCCVSSGYSKPCCQVAQPKTAAEPLPAYPKHHLWAVTYPPQRKTSISSIGTSRAILEHEPQLAMFIASHDLRDLDGAQTPPGWTFFKTNDKNQRRKRSPSACFMTCPPTSEMDLVNGMSLGQTSTQFCA